MSVSSITSSVIQHVQSEITARQRAILNFLYTYIRRCGYAPSVREIAEAIGISSTSVVTYNLNRLVHLGYLSRDKVTSRSLSLREAAYRVIQQPLLDETSEPRELRLENQRLRVYSTHLEAEQERLKLQIAALEARLFQNETYQKRRRRWSVNKTP